MNKKATTFYSFFFLSLLSAQFSFSQNLKSDSVFLATSVSNVISVHAKILNQESHLYNGPQYVNYDRGFVGHQFFQNDEITEGTVTYDNLLFRDVPLLYDTVLDQLVVEGLTNGNSIKLISEKVKDFTYNDHHFYRLQKDSLYSNLPQAGFYEFLLDGKIKLLAKRKKEIQEVKETDGIYKVFELKDKFYVLKGNKLFEVDKKRTILSLLPEKRKELQAFARTNKINFKHKREDALVKIVRHYNSLPQ
ncbi:hypothetical protein [Adhaeribacter aquaticus]|uniref:hypothetical protein n=1 Tax=Adhaeribacter aquaticus TaxID=299567 RepID=UPI0004157F32|nr:hypothetical protein [Adhaeribacter aquaticus]